MTKRLDAVDELPSFVDLHTASRRTGLSYSTLRSYVADGRLPAFSTNGRALRVKVSDLVALMQRVELN